MTCVFEQRDEYTLAESTRTLLDCLQVRKRRRTNDSEMVGLLLLREVYSIRNTTVLVPCSSSARAAQYCSSRLVQELDNDRSNPNSHLTWDRMVLCQCRGASTRTRMVSPNRSPNKLLLFTAHCRKAASISHRKIGHNIFHPDTMNECSRHSYSNKQRK